MIDHCIQNNDFERSSCYLKFLNIFNMYKNNCPTHKTTHNTDCIKFSSLRYNSWKLCQLVYT